MGNMSREKILRDNLEMARHNLFCYSKNYLMTIPMEGMENQHKEAAVEIKMLEVWLKEFHSTRIDSTREFIGTINCITFGKTFDGKPFAELIEFSVEIDEDSYSDGDVRIFHVGQEVQNWIISGQYDSEKDSRKNRLLKIRVDNIEYIRSIEWVIAENVARNPKWSLQ